MGRPTIKDIAERAGVSVRTVSRVLNDAPNVKPTTRAKVSQILRDSEFQANFAARSLRRQRTDTIIVFIAEQKSQSWAQVYTVFINHLITEARQFGYKIVVTQSDSGRLAHDSSDGYFLLRNGYADGAIIIDSWENDERLDSLDQLGIPYVLYGEDHTHDSVSYVYFDNLKAGRMVGEFLIQRDLLPAVGFFGGEKFSATCDRVAGITEALAQRIEDFTFEYNCSSFLLTYERSLSILPSVRACFVSGDERAIGVYRAAYELGIAIPNQLSVIGCDDIPLASFMTPPLTTIVQPFDLIARDAMRELMARIEHNDTPEQIIHEPQLTERGST